jgi:hypothetical protein
VSAPVDFFSSVVTLSSVVLFAKFVTHRTRSHFDQKADRWHRLCAYSCVGALLLAFAGIARGDAFWMSWLLAGLSATTLAFAVFILLRDVLGDDRGRVTAPELAAESLGRRPTTNQREEVQ